MKCLAALRQESKLGSTHWQWQSDSETKETDHENKKNEQSNCDCAGARRSGFLRPGGTGVVEHGRARRQYAHSAGRPDGMSDRGNGVFSAPVHCNERRGLLDRQTVGRRFRRDIDGHGDRSDYCHFLRAGPCRGFSKPAVDDAGWRYGGSSGISSRKE